MIVGAAAVVRFTSCASPSSVRETSRAASSLVKFSAAPLPERPEVKTPGFSMVTPSFASAASAPETVRIAPLGSRTLLALPSVSKFPLTTGAPETRREPSWTYTPPPTLPVTLPPCRMKLPLMPTHTPPPLPALLSVTLPPERVKRPPSTYTPPPLSAVLPVMLPPCRMKLPLLPTYTPPPTSLNPPVIFPSPAGFFAVAPESVTVRLVSVIIMTEPLDAAAVRPLSIVKPFRSSETEPETETESSSEAWLPPPSPYFTLAVSL